MRPWRSQRRSMRSLEMSSGRLDALLPWVPVLVGIGVMVGLLISALALSTSSFRTTARAPASQSPTDQPAEGRALGSSDGLGAGEISPSGSSNAPVPMSGSVAPSGTAGGGAPSGGRGNGGSGAGVSPSVAQPPVTVVVSGRYRVLNSFVDSFIGEVLVSNSSSSPHDWSVRLRFPSNVGNLRTSWVESQPQATLTRSGQAFIWTSTVPVNAGSSVALRFQFDRGGTNSNPDTCTVNGASCSGL